MLPSPVPFPQGPEGRVVRQVQVDRSDGDEPFLDRLEVGAGDVLAVQVVASDPVILLSPRVALLHDQVAVDPLPHPRDPHAVDSLAPFVGHVDVQQGVVGQAFLQHFSRHVERHRRSRVEPEPRAGDQRDGDGRDAEQRSLDRRGDGAGVGDIVAKVRSLVDPRDEQVDLLSPQDAVHAEVDAVGGRAVDGVDARRDLLHPQRVGERERVAGRAPLPVGGDHVHRAQVLQGVGQRLDPLGAHAVVVRNEDHAPVVNQRISSFFPREKGLREPVS